MSPRIVPVSPLLQETLAPSPQPPPIVAARAYTVDKFLALHEYAATTSAWRVVWVLTTTPLYGLICALLPSFTPMQDPLAAGGVLANPGYLFNSFLLSFIIFMGTVTHWRTSVGLPHHVYSFRQGIIVSVIAGAIQMLVALVLSLAWRFPIPMSWVVASSATGLSFAVGHLAVFRSRCWKDQRLLEACRVYLPALNIQATQIIIYPAFSVLFDHISTLYQVLLTLLFPLMKRVLKRQLRKHTSQLEGFSNEEAVSGIEIRASLYQSMILQSTPSQLATAIIMDVDVLISALLPSFVPLQDPLSGFAANPGFMVNTFLLSFLVYLSTFTHWSVSVGLPSHVYSQWQVVGVAFFASTTQFAFAMMLAMAWRFPIPMSWIVVSAISSFSIAFGHILKDFSTEVAVSGIEISASLYQSMILQNSPSQLATAIIMGVDVLQGLVTVKLFMDRPTNGTVRHLIVQEALKEIEASRQTTETSSGSSASTMSSVVPMPAKLAKTDEACAATPLAPLATVTQALTLVNAAESLLLVEYLEVAVPLVNGIFVAITCQFEGAQYNTRLRHLYFHPEALTQAIQSIALYSFLQALSFVAMHFVMKYRYGLSATYHLAFLLERHHLSIVGKMVAWLPIILHFTGIHYGVDFSFHFDFAAILQDPKLK